jgi:flavin-dependent dehydrogenase
MLGTGPKDAVVRRPIGPGWALVGDASLHQDPWTGLGMDNAAVHAGFLAEAVTGWLAGHEPEAEAFATYHQRRDAHALDGFDETARYGRDLSVLAS